MALFLASRQPRPAPPLAAVALAPAAVGPLPLTAGAAEELRREPRPAECGARTLEEEAKAQIEEIRGRRNAAPIC